MTTRQEPEPTQVHHMLERVSEVSETLPWSPQVSLVSESLKEQVCHAALFVAQRMSDPERVAEYIQLANKQTSFPIQWSDASFASGYAGLAIMYQYIAQCFPGEGWERCAYLYMKRAASSTSQFALSHSSLFSGTAGMAMALHLLSQSTDRYQGTLAKLNHHLYHQILFQKQVLQADHLLSYGEYDIVTGASGLLFYLVSLKEPNAEIVDAIEELLAYLIALFEPGQELGAERWYISAEALSEMERPWYPEGQFNCGLAHGAPGPLAALAITWLSGYRYPGMREVMTYISNWLVQHQLVDEWGRNWPAAIPLQQARQRQNWETLPPARAGWCYGTPGIARSLWLAGKALRDEQLCHIALETLEATLRRPPHLLALDSPTICHGKAGLLQICLRFAHETGNAVLMQHIPLLLNSILETFSEEHPIGFRDLERPPDVYVDQPGWLTGAPGVALVLLAAATGVPPRWDRMLGLA